ncbi:hypothetical protein SNE40_014687 [Patella caerulea]|uniref:NADH dehydrogenase [ubiquinone] 1 alpha subcomplex subunit 12 n=2 Tax=Patella caerulea TaxID=87958 RepID=A0AAN8JHE9_PATCE
MSKYLEKFSRMRTIIADNGGLINSIKTIYRTDELKSGRLVGEDGFGNKYYENKSYFMGRSRWVDYSLAVNLDYDASQVPPEWHRWLHYIADEPPTEAQLVKRKWMINHSENPTGTDKIYVPYSTVKPKVQAWSPPSK